MFPQSGAAAPTGVGNHSICLGDFAIIMSWDRAFEEVTASPSKAIVTAVETGNDIKAFIAHLLCLTSSSQSAEAEFSTNRRTARVEIDVCAVFYAPNYISGRDW